MQESILFDARLVLGKPTGIGQYIVALLAELIRLAPETHFHLLRRADPWPGYGLAEWCAPNLSQHLSQLPHMALQQHVVIPRLAQQLNVQLIHYPHFDAPVFWGRLPVVTTIHDAKYLVHPEFFTNLSQVKRQYMRFSFAQSLKRSAGVIVVSHNTAKDLARLFKTPLSRLSVIYEAADARFQPATALAVESLREQYHLSRPFLLTVGEYRPHKNHVGLIQAYANSQSRQTHDLVIIGQAYQDYTEPQLLVQQLGLTDQVHFLSGVPFADLITFYTAAELFVLVSFYEGFGLPILEAMACGAPVLCSATTAAGEITGEGGLTVDPHDSGAITQQIDALLQNPALRQQWIVKGAAWRQHYTWEQAAQQTLALYQKVLKTPKIIIN
ncbi:MAG: glycosyltransferase family 1 protein [Chloroflexi bacterium]|nr:glycosyltransferase family 1 protein [Chloroflexota bacterium]